MKYRVATTFSTKNKLLIKRFVKKSGVRVQFEAEVHKP